MGPRTGRGMGRCNGGVGRGRGMGRGFGAGINRSTEDLQTYKKNLQTELEEVDKKLKEE
jgi:hypothetical protein